MVGTHIGSTESVDRLFGIANNKELPGRRRHIFPGRHRGVGRYQQQYDFCLNGVCILEFVYANVPEPALKIGPDRLNDLAGTRQRKNRLETEVRRLVSAVAESGHSKSLLEEIGRKEAELQGITDRLVSATPESIESRVGEIKGFITSGLNDLRGLLRKDTALARTELASFSPLAFLSRRVCPSRLCQFKGSFHLFPALGNEAGGETPNYLVFSQNKLVFRYSTVRLRRDMLRTETSLIPFLANDRCSAMSSIWVRFDETDYVSERHEGGTERTREIRIRDDFCLVKALAQKRHGN